MGRSTKWWLAAALSAGLHGLGVAALACFKVARHDDRAVTPCEVAYISIEPVAEPPPLKSTMRSHIVEISMLDPSEASSAPPAAASLSKPDTPGQRPDPPAPGGAQLGNPQPAVPNGQGSSTPGVPGATFFGVPCKGKNIVYLIDSSSSMGANGALETARRELRASLLGLPEGVHFQIIVFHSQSKTLLGPDGWLLPDAETVERVESSLRELQAEGKTDYDQALRRALSYRPDVLYFLTDACDLPPRLIFDTTRRNAGRSIIHAIELGTRVVQRPECDLRLLARQNGGDFRQCRPTP